MVQGSHVSARVKVGQRVKVVQGLKVVYGRVSYTVNPSAYDVPAYRARTSPTSLTMHSCMMRSVSIFLLYSCPMNWILPSIRCRALYSLAASRASSILMRCLACAGVSFGFSVSICKRSDSTDQSSIVRQLLHKGLVIKQTADPLPSHSPANAIRVSASASVISTADMPILDGSLGIVDLLNVRVSRSILCCTNLLLTNASGVPANWMQQGTARHRAAR